MAALHGLISMGLRLNTEADAVIKKWLSYRDEAVLGRALTKEEAREVTGMVRRLTAIVLMSDAMDANYVAACTHPFAWSKAEKPPTVTETA